jgi:hypothetical protein
MSTSMRCRNNNHHHNNNCSYEGDDTIDATVGHEGCIVAKIHPPAEKKNWMRKFIFKKRTNVLF